MCSSSHLHSHHLANLDISLNSCRQHNRFSRRCWSTRRIFLIPLPLHRELVKEVKVESLVQGADHLSLRLPLNIRWHLESWFKRALSPRLSWRVWSTWTSFPSSFLHFPRGCLEAMGCCSALGRLPWHSTGSCRTACGPCSRGRWCWPTGNGPQCGSSPFSKEIIGSTNLCRVLPRHWLRIHSKMWYARCSALAAGYTYVTLVHLLPSALGQRTRRSSSPCRYHRDSQFHLPRALRPDRSLNPGQGEPVQATY